MQPLIAHPGSYRAAFFAALTVLALPQIYGMVRLRPDRDASVHDRGSYRVLHGCVGAGVLLAYGTATQMDGAAIIWGRHALFDAGLALMFGGAIAGLYTISLLGRSFTVQVAVRPGQQIVEAGPYRWVRHPSYAAQLVSLLGFALLLTNWASV